MVQYTFSAINIIAVTLNGPATPEQEAQAREIATRLFSSALASADDMIVPVNGGQATVDIYPGDDLELSCTGE